MIDMNRIVSGWRLAVSAALGVFATALFLMNEYKWAPYAYPISWIVNMLVILPFLFAGIISGNMHAPNEYVAYCLLFLEYLVIAKGLKELFGFAKQMRRKCPD